MFNKDNIYMFKLNIILIFLLGLTFTQETLAIVTKSNGDVFYKHYLKKDFDNKLNMGLQLFNNDLIKTGNDGFIKFTYLDDGTTIKVHNNSELYVRGQVSSKNINKRINISNGLIKLDVSKQTQDDFVIITPTSVASVKGTILILDAKEDGDTFYGYEGIVEVLNKESNQIIKLSKNLKVISKPDGIITSTIITQKESAVLENFIRLDQDTEIKEQDESGGESDDHDTSTVNQLKIKVYTSSGEEKTIIIKYNE